MDTNELHEELLRIGRQPVPPPRQEFVDELLARIKLGDDLPAPAPIQLVPRQPWIRFRMVAAGAVAAALLAAVGLFSLARENSGSPTPLNLKSADLTLAQPVSETSKNLKITEDGKVTGDPPPTGDIKATCQAEARIKVGDKVFACQANDVVRLTIADGQVKEAFNETTQTGPVAAPAAKSQPQLAAPAATGSTTTSSTAAPPPSSVSGTASEVPKSTSTVPQGSTLPPTPQSIPGPGITVAPTTFDLVKVANDAIVTVSWPPYSGTEPFRYVVLQTLSATNNQPDTPMLSTQADKSNAVATVPAGTTSYSVTLDGKTGNIPVNTHFVSFRVAVLDNSDTLLALSNTLTLELKWAPIKPAEATTTTTTTSTSTTTTTTTTTTTASGPQATTK